MEIKELRLGNLVSYRGEISKITGLCDNCLVRVSNDSGDITLQIGELSSIQLTESWFKENGFVENNNYGFPILSNSILRADVYDTGNGWHIHIDDRDYCTSFSGVVKDLHTLQNIYFFSTGDDL